MNTRIKDLTRTYLDSLNLPYYSRLDDDQKRRIIEINSQSEWIIFNAGSLKANKQEAASYTNMLRVDDRGYLWFQRGGLSRPERDIKISDYIRQNRDRIGLVGDYRLGILRGSEFREGEFEEELDNHNNYVGLRQSVCGCLRRPDGGVSGLQQIRAVDTDIDRGFSVESYNMTSTQLQDIFQEAVKIYYTYYQSRPSEIPEGIFDLEEVNLNELDKPASFNFIGGDGDRVGVNSAALQHIRTNPAFSVDYQGIGKENYWGVVNKNKIMC